MNPHIEKRRALGHQCPAFSSSKTSSKTDVYDQRVVGGDDSVNVSASGNSSVSVLATDHGAISGGLALGTQAINAAARSAEATAATGASMFEGAVAAVEKAYQSGQAGDQVQLKYAGFVVVGLAAVLLLPRIVKS